LEETYEISLRNLNTLRLELNKAQNTLEEFYMQQKPAATPIKDSPWEFQILDKEVQKLQIVKAGKPVTLGYTVMPARNTATDAAATLLC